MNIEEVQRRLWEQSHAHKTEQGIRDPALSDQPVW